MTNKQSWGDNWENELLVLCEKYCKHDDREYNSCLWHIFHPFIKKLLTSKSEQMEGEKIGRKAWGEEDKGFNAGISTAIEILKK